MKVTIFSASCRLCKAKYTALSENKLIEKHEQHLRTCPMYAELQRWEKAGVAEMMWGMYQTEGFMEDLERLMRKWRKTVPDMREALEQYESYESVETHLQRNL